MSFRGGRGGGRGGGRSPGGRGGRGRGGGGGRFGREEGPPAEILEAGSVLHDCESELVCKWTVNDKVPYFNAGVYLENKRKIGKVDEILGKVAEIFFTIKMDPGIQSKSFQPNDLVYIGTDKLLPLTRFTNPGAPGGGGVEEDVAEAVEDAVVDEEAVVAVDEVLVAVGVEEEDSLLADEAEDVDLAVEEASAAEAGADEVLVAVGVEEEDSLLADEAEDVDLAVEEASAAEAGVEDDNRRIRTVLPSR
eukprot:CAMPEP_0113514360 /NCGR_PEP_ID=MMETSP0014_2-20120614/40364_1 /TAXON_ID=2857 /ORGANISM="Nitzschia sp." /LENGTH=248 /DNA_ID=CAMNT_0000410845 /DNA_START=61 /DNA_END=806 /DNA_ORIENTATION=- /assembly_acc=CAM_ASM_000159